MSDSLEYAHELTSLVDTIQQAAKRGEVIRDPEQAITRIAALESQLAASEAKCAELERHIETRDAVTSLHIKHQLEVDDQLAASEAKCAELIAWNQETVRIVAENRLDGYRELGARAAAAENERDDMRRDLTAALTRAEEAEKGKAEAERLAVWAAKETGHGFVSVWQRSVDTCFGGVDRTYEHDNTPAGILAALRQAEEGTR